VAIDADATERTVNGSIDVPTESTEHVNDPAGTGEESTPARPSGAPGFRLALVVGLATVLALGGLAAWFGHGAYQAQQADKQRNRFLAVGKQGAVNLTTIDYTDAEADIQRILDSSTGQFFDDFSKRAPAFVDLVKLAKSKTQASITDAGVESVSGDSAQVLVAVAVNTTTAGTPDPSVRHWRMRIDVQKVGDTVKVSNVGFVP
jgi:Mce-associated membrane protein